MRRFVTFGPAFVVMLAACVTLLATPRVARMVSFARTEAMMTVAQQSLDEDDVLERMNRATRNIAAAVEPSVVHIDVRLGRRGRSGSEAPRERERPRATGSTGSGWVYDNQGHIVTNAHVVRGAEAISVQFFDGRLADATLLGADPFTDIAVLKVDTPSGLFPARRATDDQPEQGDRVFAFGSPFGFKFSMSEGIVSGLGRTARAPMDFGSGFSAFIQTDAAVNPGNSGGPLVDVRGRVIGMNVAIAIAAQPQGASPDEGQSSGISFAIPLGTIESTVGQLIRTGRITRGYLGIRFSSATENVPIEDESGFHGVGVLVEQVDPPDGPAGKAGIRAGDIITTIAGHSITAAEVLRSVVSSTEPGRHVGVRLWREGRFMDVDLVLGEMPSDLLTRQATTSAIRQILLALPAQLGMRVEATEDGVRVAYVEADSVADEAGLKVGQIIVRVADQPVLTPFDFFAQLVDAGLLKSQPVEVQYREREESGEGFKPEPVTTRLRLQLE